jgi:hypothetical protein
MNRAWIPAGALAGMSVAGLLALGPVTDSLSTPVEFATSVPTRATTVATRSSVPVSVTLKNVGSTKTAAFTARGAHATSTGPTSDTGFVSNKRSTTPRYSTSNTPAVSNAPAKPKVEPKKPPKRQQSIGTTGELNSDQGLAGGSGTGSTGEQASTPGSGTP